MDLLLSVICPTYNEENYIEGLLQFFTTVNPDNKELIIIDGGSTDKTIEIVDRWTAKYNNIRLIHNENKTVPFALNIGIKESKGKIIVRLDAHSRYSNDYFEKIIETFDATGADIVGGPTRIAFKDDFQEAYSVVFYSKMGYGDSKVHETNFNGFTDHVTFGAWKKDIFKDIGFFDTELVRNQDIEFHYRAKSKGKTIFLNSEIKLWYYPRNNFKDLFVQNFKNGYYKPIVMKKINSEIKIRHLVAPMFCLYLAGFPLVFFSYLWFIPLILYIFIIKCIALSSKLSFKKKINILKIFPAIHIADGIGFIAGLKKLFN